VPGGGFLLPACAADGGLLVAPAPALPGKPSVSSCTSPLPRAAGRGLLLGQAATPGGGRVRCWVTGGAPAAALGLEPARGLLAALAVVRRGGGAVVPAPQTLGPRRVVLGTRVAAWGGVLALGGGLVFWLGLLADGGLALAGGLDLGGGLDFGLVLLAGGAWLVGLGMRLSWPLGGGALRPGSRRVAEEPGGGGRRGARCCCCCCCWSGGLELLAARGGGLRAPPASSPASGVGRWEAAGPGGVLNSTWQLRDSTCSWPLSVSRTVKGPLAGLTGVS
jgi:hypothetical protein